MVWGFGEQQADLHRLQIWTLLQPFASVNPQITGDTASDLSQPKNNQLCNGEPRAVE